ncbi:F-box protein At3g56470-like [Phragmites australis]|uniref:F-box protein At3g56470-like n=1 Tax=Phragmites australis TaxID=29695 RepID=UPI002D7847CA|nr:F-box protein At3g56470-like [Phragmites australis]
MTSSWSDLPIDLLLGILHHLELPEILAFAAVCSSWCSAATAAAALPCRAPWLMSWDLPTEEREQLRKHGRHFPVSNVFHTLLNPEKNYKATFPQPYLWNCCGASHGWLILANKLSNLVMCNPFTLAKIPLPPITDFTCVEAVYGSEGNLVGYRFGSDGRLRGLKALGIWFYQKVALSCTPSQGGVYTVMIIHRDCDWLSFARAGEDSWHVVSTLDRREDSYTDCVYHNGKFYTVTMEGIVEMWDIDGSYEPKKEVIINKRRNSKGRIIITDRDKLFTRYLVSTPWGDLLQVRPILARGEKCPKNVMVKIDKVDVEGRQIIALRPETALQEHAVFLGLNHSSCLPTNKFHELRPNCIYFTTPQLRKEKYFDLVKHGWRGVRIYDLENSTLEDIFPYNGSWEVWITPNN